MRQVHRQGANGGSADRIASNYHRSVPAKVSVPDLAARIEKADDAPRFPIPAGKVRALVEIAGVAGQRKIRRDSFTTVLLRDDMVNVKRKRISPLWHQAVFAAWRAR